jgi:hypothetical protein
MMYFGLMLEIDVTRIVMSGNKCIMRIIRKWVIS